MVVEVGEGVFFLQGTRNGMYARRAILRNVCGLFTKNPPRHELETGSLFYDKTASAPIEKKGIKRAKVSYIKMLCLGFVRMEE